MNSAFLAVLAIAAGGVCTAMILYKNAVAKHDPQSTCQGPASQIANGIITKEPKTKSSIRTLTFGNTVHRLLTEYRLWQNKRRLKAGADWVQTDRLFTTKNGEPLSPDSISCWFKRFIRISGLPIVTLHSLRHSNATLMIAEDVDIATVSKRLGHSNTATTLNIYTMP